MKKYLICLVVLFSAFLVSDKVSAKEIEQFCEYTEPCLTTDDIDNIIKNNNIDTSIYDSYLFIVTKPFSINSDLPERLGFDIVFFDYDNLNNGLSFKVDDYLQLLMNSSGSASFYLYRNYNIENFNLNNITLDLTSFQNSERLRNSFDINNIDFPYYTNVDILDSDGNVLLEKNIYNMCDLTNPCVTVEDLQEHIKNLEIDTSIYNSYLLFAKSSSLSLYFFKSSDLENIFINESSGNLYLNGSDYYFYGISGNTGPYGLEDMGGPVFGENGSYFNLIDNSTIDYAYYVNFDLLDNNGNIILKKNIDEDVEEEFTVNFHLNGGVAVDSYQSNTEKNELIDKVKEILEIDKILELYPSLSGSMMDLFKDPSEKKFSKFCKDWIIDVETQYEALKYYQKLINNDYAQPITYTEDFSIKIYPEDFEDYIKNLSITKQNMRFQGFFYDKQYANEISNNFLIDSDKDIYAKWDYEDVNAFLNDTNFNSYTFDTNYTYAIISIGKNYGQDIYLGLDFLGYNLEIYRYKKDGNNLENGSSFCITPYYSKGDKYYYRIKTTDTSNYNIFILPREKLETVQNGEVINYYNFLVSDNAHVTYTNDLKSIVIFDDNDNELIIDLEDRYNYAQDALISDESNLLGIFKELLGNMDDNIFSYFNQIWNHFKANKFYMYFMLLITGAVVIVIIRAANRK